MLGRFTTLSMKGLTFFAKSLIIDIDKVLNTSRSRGGSRAAATSKMERFVIIVNGFQPLTIITKRSILDIAAALDLPLLRLVGPAYIRP